MYHMLHKMLTIAVETIKRQTMAAYGWFVIGQSVGAG